MHDITPNSVTPILDAFLTLLIGQRCTAMHEKLGMVTGIVEHFIFKTKLVAIRADGLENSSAEVLYCPIESADLEFKFTRLVEAGWTLVPTPLFSGCLIHLQHPDQGVHPIREAYQILRQIKPAQTQTGPT